ncbi:S24/S26 family peptidase [Chloroflexota bacterium]
MLKSREFNEPRFFTINPVELTVSGKALADIMREVLNKGASFRFCARGWSMMPFIRNGDVITISPVLQGPPRLGDVVAYVRFNAGSLVVHRIIARRGSTLVIKGDGVSGYSEDLVPPHNLLGKITRVERKGRTVWLGFGPEKFVIAWFSSRRMLFPLLVLLSSCLRLLRRI